MVHGFSRRNSKASEAPGLNVSASGASRFARLPPLSARLLLLLLAGLVALAAVSSVQTRMDGQGSGAPEKAERANDDRDLVLYDRIIDRLRQGDGYYQAAVAEHRALSYPLRPGLTVRLPTLAKIQSWLPVPPNPAQRGMPERVIAIVLFAAMLIGWQRRLSEEVNSPLLRSSGLVLLAIGGHIATTRYYLVLHELWAGAFLALSLAYYRPEKGKWAISWLAAAAALAIRELALPFVLLMAAQAIWCRRWREAWAWVALVALFAAALAFHLKAVAALVRPDDLEGLSWFTFRGFEGWITTIVQSSPLFYLPIMLSGPLVVLMVFGWAAWRTQIATFSTLLFVGYGLAFMIAGRAENWYWGLIIAPTMWLGLAFVPMAIRGLLEAGWTGARRRRR